MVKANSDSIVSVFMVNKSLILTISEYLEKGFRLALYNPEILSYASQFEFLHSSSMSYKLLCISEF